jgi:hypothetical protein
MVLRTTSLFFFDIGIVVLVILTAPGEGDAVGLTPVFEMPVDELAVIAVQASEGDRKSLEDVEGLEGPGFCFF